MRFFLHAEQRHVHSDDYAIVDDHLVLRASGRNVAAHAPGEWSEAEEAPEAAQSEATEAHDGAHPEAA